MDDRGSSGRLSIRFGATPLESRKHRVNDCVDIKNYAKDVITVIPFDKNQRKPLFHWLTIFDISFPSNHSK